MQTVTIAEQIAAVEREISYRKKFYPRWVQQGKMTQDEADLQLRRMSAACDTLKRAMVELDNREVGKIFSGEVYGPAKVRADERARVLAALAPMVHTDVLLRLQKKLATAGDPPRI